MEKLLTLQDYSSKYNISISTLRRRIKCQELDFIFKGGRYFIKEPEAFSQNPQGLEREREREREREFYKGLLKKKDKEIKKLKEEKEDLIHLVALLEDEKTSLESLVFNQHQNQSFFS